MKKIFITLMLGCLCLCNGFRAHAQAEELAQLALDIEKLVQFKQILSDLKAGYDILFGGYTTIKNLSEGNFSLHKTFLDGLMAVSPTVRKYKKVADIINDQILLLQEYKKAFNRFRQDDNFSPGEIDYISRVYSNLVDQSLKDLDDLTIVITDGKLRMSDDERLAAIDQVYDRIEDKLSFLRHFNNTTTVLSLQRSKAKNDVKTMQRLYDVKD